MWLPRGGLIPIAPSSQMLSSPVGAAQSFQPQRPITVALAGPGPSVPATVSPAPISRRVESSSADRPGRTLLAATALGGGAVSHGLLDFIDPPRYVQVHRRWFLVWPVRGDVAPTCAAVAASQRARLPTNRLAARCRQDLRLLLADTDSDSSAFCPIPPRWPCR